MRDSNSFDELYRGTSARMLRYGYAVVGDLTEAQDLVQEAYARAWRQWRALGTHPDLEAWLRLVIVRLANDRWRRLARNRLIGWRAGTPDRVPAPSEDSVVVLAALRRLPMAQRQALALHYLFDVPIADIAEETGAAVGTVKSWLSRGRARLATVLEEANDE
jgi:RNA polymerase sigma-70 factor (ECF subfamily)